MTGQPEPKRYKKLLRHCARTHDLGPEELEKARKLHTEVSNNPDYVTLAQLAVIRGSTRQAVTQWLTRTPECRRILAPGPGPSIFIHKGDAEAMYMARHASVVKAVIARAAQKAMQA